MITLKGKVLTYKKEAMHFEITTLTLLFSSGIPLCPATSSMIMTPKLYMSDLTDILPRPNKFSGAPYPLHEIRKIQTLRHNYKIRRFM
jgi:hypothetical protein